MPRASLCQYKIDRNVRSSDANRCPLTSIDANRRPQGTLAKRGHVMNITSVHQGFNSTKNTMNLWESNMIEGYVFFRTRSS